jgi:hypothetical protein
VIGIVRQALWRVPLELLQLIRDDIMLIWQ